MVTSGISEKQILSALARAAAQDFQSLQHRVVYPKGEKVFVEGGQPSGVFVLSTGSARLSISNADGNVLISRKALLGEVLGLSAIVSGKPYQMTAQTTASSEFGFIRRDDFLRFLREHSDAAFRVVELLSDNLADVPVRARRARARRAAN